MNWLNFLTADRSRHKALTSAMIMPEAGQCVQCGICSFHCPIGIDVRRHAWKGEPVRDSHCLTCGECVQRCPRGVLRFERTHLFSGDGLNDEAAV